MRILIVEDEIKIAHGLRDALKTAGFVPELAYDGEDGWFKGSTETYAAVILDINLPKLDGLTVLRSWRSEGRGMPVILLTAMGSWPERVEGIDSGADDYLVKPFHMEELLARLRALLRRGSDQASTILTCGELTLDTRQMQVTIAGGLIKTTPLEFRLLQFLLHNTGAVCSQEDLATAIYFQDQEPGSNAIEVLVSRLRRKLKSNILRTKRGFGFYLSETEI